MKSLSLWTLFLFGSLLSWAGDLSVNQESLFAVVTHKAGLLSSLGHDHFIHAGAIDNKATMDANDVTSFRFEMTLKVKDLVVDDPDMKKTWFPSLKEAGVMEEDFSSIKPDQRKTVAKRMLGKKQLKADSFPLIKAWVEGVKEKKGMLGSVETTHELTLKIEIRGKDQTYSVPAVIHQAEQALHIRAIAPMNFSDFGIKPFSAMLGSVANENQFHIFVDFKASLPTSP